MTGICSLDLSKEALKMEMMTSIRILVVALTLLYGFRSAASAVCNAGDKQALLTFKSQFSDDGKILGTWNPTSNCCTWQGITCNAAGRVTNLFIDSSTNFKLKVKAGVKNAAGSIGSLTELTALDFFNAVQFAYAHPIPPQFGNLVKLVSLTMYQTQFTGAIPMDLGKLVKLGDMLLAGNRFTGGIPDSFANLKLLTRLILSDNKLKTIGSQRITLLKNLQMLDLSNNLLSGPIPKWLGKLTISDIIDLSQNAFTGPLPGELCNIQGLQRISIHDTKVTAIPPQIGKCAALTELVLYNNKIQGKLPAELGNCFNLFRLDVSGNVLSGTLPESLGSLRNLQDFNIANNKFTGKIPASYGPFQDNEFVSFTDLSRNMLSGQIPQSLSTLRAAVFRPGNPGLCGTPLLACK